MIIRLTSTLPSLSLAQQRVLLRADLNVQLSILKTYDYRLRAILPTLDLILKKGGKIILTTHIGRPKGYDQALSTQHLIPWFTAKGYTIDFARDLEQAHKKSFENKKAIVLVENLRFFPGEKSQDPTFAKNLAALGDMYVNDAFALIHRADTSVTLVPQLFAPEKRTIGLLMEKELHELSKLVDTPAQPFVLMCGGGKVTDKIPLIAHLLEKTNMLMLCPAIVFTFLKVQGKKVGKSLVDDGAQAVCREILATAAQRGVKIIWPVDYQVADKTFDGPLSLVDANQFPQDGVGVSIGPKTAALFGAEIRRAKTIFYNGTMGTPLRPETLQGFKEILLAMGNSAGFSVIGGGDSVAAAQLLGLADRVSYLSTGGGATLAYLSGQQLPGLAIFINA